MLFQLRIKNFVIIEELTLSFKKGLNILTGETGAGKSILIDALSGILGDRMTTDLIRTGFEKSTLEGEFEISGIPQLKKTLEEAGIEFDDDIIVLKRELYASGKGRCFVNTTQIPVSKLREISEYLVDIHGQNEHQSIAKVSKHRELLDSFGELQSEVDKVRNIYHELNEVQEKLNSFDIDEREKARRIEYFNFALKEIASANLKPGEEEELKNESVLLANAEKLFKEINNSSQRMNSDHGVLQQLKAIEQGLSKVSVYDPEISSILDVIKDALYNLEDTGIFLRNYQSGIDFSPNRINEVEERIAQISSLKKKYGDSIEEILEYADKTQKELDAISSSDEQRDKLQTQYKELVIQARDLALNLSKSRQSAAKKLEDKVIKELSDLGMAGTIFKVQIKQENDPNGQIKSNGNTYMLYPHGLDIIEFLLSANKGEDLRQLRKVASGGEMSRIMLALKNVILSADIVESLIFDEVDAGISGKTAEIVGKKLKILAKDRQVLVITHLPQIAAMSDCHFSVQKGQSSERVTTVVKNLNQKEKIREVARMLAGETITDLSLQHAEEMVVKAEAMQ